MNTTRFSRPGKVCPPHRPIAQHVANTDLLDYGITPQEARRRWPHAVEYTALDGSPVYLAEALEGEAP